VRRGRAGERVSQGGGGGLRGGVEEKWRAGE